MVGAGGRDRRGPRARRARAGWLQEGPPGSGACWHGRAPPPQGSSWLSRSRTVPQDQARTAPLSAREKGAGRAGWAALSAHRGRGLAVA